jgi:hypothetical protein
VVSHRGSSSSESGIVVTDTGDDDDDVFICLNDDDDVFYLFLQKQIGAELHIYLEEGTYHERLFGGPSTNDMKK